MITCEMDNITFEQRVFCCKQPDGRYGVGLCWTPISEWKSYDPDDLPETLDTHADFKWFAGKEWRDAKKYAQTLCDKYNLPLHQ